MIYTNRNGLPQPIVDAVTNDSYSRGDCDISVTELISPPRIRQLRRKYDAVLTEDVSERLWALLGQVGHGILQRAAGGAGSDIEPAITALDRALVLLDESANGSQVHKLVLTAFDVLRSQRPKPKTGEMVEHRFFMNRSGYRISGQVDYMPQEREINDYKLCSYHVAKNGAKPEWIEQLNIYRLLANANGVPVDKLKIVAIYRDWSKMAAKRQDDYPQEQVHVFTLPVWSDADVESYVAERVRLHKAAEAQLPECTAEERWEKPAKFALMVKGRKRAVKLYDSEAEALAAVSDNKQFVEPRPGEWVRCENYCAVAPYCTQFRTYMMDKCA